MRYIVLGAGLSGLAAARYLQQKNADMVLFDDNAKKLAPTHPQSTNKRPTLSANDVLVLSPGIPARHPLVMEGKGRGVKIYSEIDLGLKDYRGMVVAITGTNGKSSVTTMLDCILKGLGLSSAVAGNIGTPVTKVLMQKVPDILLLELSSFQLEHTELLSPQVAVWTNFAPDHLARHCSLAAYFAIKNKVFTTLVSGGLGITDHAVYRRLPSLAQIIAVVTTEPGKKGENFFRLDGLDVYKDDTHICDFRRLSRQDKHDTCNALMATLAAAHLTRKLVTELVPYLESYRGLPHRLQLLGYVAGHEFIDDSKATNLHATLAALEAQTKPVLLILGGSKKEETFLPLVSFRSKIAAVITFGHSGQEICTQLKDYFAVENYENLAAVATRLRRTPPKSSVLFSPACATDDEFRDFKARGKFLRTKLEDILIPTKE